MFFACIQANGLLGSFPAIISPQFQLLLFAIASAIAFGNFLGPPNECSKGIDAALPNLIAL